MTVLDAAGTPPRCTAALPCGSLALRGGRRLVHNLVRSRLQRRALRILLLPPLLLLGLRAGVCGDGDGLRALAHFAGAALRRRFCRRFNRLAGIAGRRLLPAAQLAPCEACQQRPAT